MGFTMKNRGRQVNITGIGKPQEDGAMAIRSKCHHIILHAVTKEERAEVNKRLEYSRSIGDSTGVILALAQLGGCPIRKESK